MIGVTVFIEETETTETFMFPPETKVKQVIEFIQVNNLKGAVFDPKKPIEDPPPIQHDLILVPPDTVSESK